MIKLWAASRNARDIHYHFLFANDYNIEIQSSIMVKLSLLEARFFVLFAC